MVTHPNYKERGLKAKTLRLKIIDLIMKLNHHDKELSPRIRKKIERLNIIKKTLISWEVYPSTVQKKTIVDQCKAIKRNI